MMETVSEPTSAQLDCLRLAAADPQGIRYYKGGWYSVPAGLGDWQYQPAVGGPYVTHGTVDACVRAGWLRTLPDQNVYRQRWYLTSEGRAEVNRAAPIREVRLPERGE